MNVYYIKRARAVQCEHWGVQVSPCKTQLLRATTIGTIASKKPMKVIWEWVCTGKRIEGAELERLMRKYPICEFQEVEDLSHRAKKRATQAAKPGPTHGPTV